MKLRKTCFNPFSKTFLTFDFDYIYKRKKNEKFLYLNLSTNIYIRHTSCYIRENTIQFSKQYTEVYSDFFHFLKSSDY